MNELSNSLQYYRQIMGKRTFKSIIHQKFHYTLTHKILLVIMHIQIKQKKEQKTDQIESITAQEYRLSSILITKNMSSSLILTAIKISLCLKVKVIIYKLIFLHHRCGNIRNTRNWGRSDIMSLVLPANT